VDGNLHDEFEGYWDGPFEPYPLDITNHPRFRDLFSPKIENGYLLLDNLGDTMNSREIINGSDLVGKKFGSIIKLENISDELIFFTIYEHDNAIFIGFTLTINDVLGALLGYTNSTQIVPTVSVGLPGYPSFQARFKNSTLGANPFDWNFYSFEVTDQYYNGTHNITSIDYYINGQFDVSIDFPMNLTQYDYFTSLSESVYGVNHSVAKFDKYYDDLNSHSINYQPTDISFFWRTSTDNSTWNDWNSTFDVYTNPINEIGTKYFGYRIDMNTTNRFNSPILNDIDLNFEYRQYTPFGINEEIFYNFTSIPEREITNITLSYYINNFHSNEEKNPISFEHNSSGYTGSPELNNADTYFTSNDNPIPYFYDFYFNLSDALNDTQQLYLKAKYDTTSGSANPSIQIYNWTSGNFVVLNTDNGYNYLVSGLIVLDEPYHYIYHNGSVIIRILSGTVTTSLEFYYLGIIPTFDAQLGFYNFDTDSYDYLTPDFSLRDTILLDLNHFNGTNILINFVFNSNTSFIVDYNTTVTVYLWEYQNTTYYFDYQLNESTRYYYEDIEVDSLTNENTTLTIDWRTSTNGIDWQSWNSNLTPNSYEQQYIQYRITMNTTFKYSRSELNSITLNLIYENISLYYTEFELTTTISNWGDFFINETLIVDINPDTLLTLNSSIEVLGSLEANTTPTFLLWENIGTVTADTYIFDNQDGFQELDGVYTHYETQKTWLFEVPNIRFRIKYEADISNQYFEEESFDLIFENFRADANFGGWNAFMEIYNYESSEYDIFWVSPLGIIQYFDLSYTFNKTKYSSTEGIVTWRITSGIYGPGTFISNIYIDFMTIDIGLNYQNVSIVGDIELPIDYNYNSTAGEVRIRFSVYTQSPFTIDFEESYVELWYRDVLKYVNVTFSDTDFSTFNELNFWYNYSGENQELFLQFYYGQWTAIDLLDQSEQNFAYFGSLQHRFEQYWINITALQEFNYTQIRLFLVLSNLQDISDIATFDLKRFELIQYNEYRLENESNRQRYDILEFQEDTQTLLIVDFAGRELYRKEVTYSEEGRFLDIFFNIAEITLKNYLNITVWFEFDSRGATLSYAVPAFSERNVKVLLGDYLFRVTTDEELILQVRQISITDTNKSSFKIGDEPEEIVIPPSTTFLDLLIQAVQWLLTDPVGITILVILGIWIASILYRRIRDRRKESTEEAYKRGYRKAKKDYSRKNYRGSVRA
jgi:hypothetical protein